MVSVPRAGPGLLAELAKSHTSAQDQVALGLRSAFSERKRGVVRALPSLVFRLISRIFSGGHP